MPNVKRLMKQANPQLKKITSDKKQFKAVSGSVNKIFNNMNQMYNVGAEHRTADKEKLSRIDFECDKNNIELLYQYGNLPTEEYLKLVDLLYGAYCDGYNRIKR